MLKLISCVAFISLPFVTQAENLDSSWRLRVEKPSHRVVAEATIRLTSEIAARSCMGGEWKRVIVVTKSGDEKFFPLSEPLADQLDKGFLTLGRVAVCDGYLFLGGRYDNESIRGEYNAVGLGGHSPLGHFSMDRIR